MRDGAACVKSVEWSGSREAFAEEDAVLDKDEFIVVAQDFLQVGEKDRLVGRDFDVRITGEGLSDSVGEDGGFEDDEVGRRCFELCDEVWDGACAVAFCE